MTLPELKAVLLAAVESAPFRAQVQVDPAVLTGYDLSEREVEALLSGSAEMLAGLGVDLDLARRGLGGPSETAGSAHADDAESEPESPAREATPGNNEETQPAEEDLTEEEEAGEISES